MTIFKFGGSTAGTPGTTVTQDHIFASTTERDDYFSTRLSELVTGTPIVVTVSGRPVFQTWAAAVPADADAYNAANWATQDAIDGARILQLLDAMPTISVQTQAQSDTTDSVSGLTVGRVPSSDRVRSAGQSGAYEWRACFYTRAGSRIGYCSRRKYRGIVRGDRIRRIE